MTLYDHAYAWVMYQTGGNESAARAYGNFIAREAKESGSEDFFHPNEWPRFVKEEKRDFSTGTELAELDMDL